MTLQTHAPTNFAHVERAEGLVHADPGAVTPIGVSRKSPLFFSLVDIYFITQNKIPRSLYFVSD